MADPFPTSSSAPPPPRSKSLPPGLCAGMIVGGKYELVRKLGTGAMGEVWAALHKTLHEEVAIKLVMRGVDHEDGTSAESRFLLEARVAAALSRKTRHIVAVTDHGECGSLGYLVMELLAGEGLDQRINRTGPQPLAKVSPMITQIARGLSIAHAEGVVHRDLKPTNVFVTLDEDGNAVAKVLDFGIAKLRRGLDRKAAHATQRGFLLGTPAYMSPEQARGKQLDHRADVWALAVIAYHMLTGEFPFDGENGEDLFARLCRIEFTPISKHRPDLPLVVSDFFARAFAERIENRFQSALALAGAFEQLEPLAAGAKLSLPPPPALAIIDHPFDDALALEPAPRRGSRHDIEPSLIVAGVPEKRGLVPRILAGVLLSGVLVATGSLLGVYFERDPRMGAGLSAGVTVPDPLADSRAIPPPEAPTEKAGGPAMIAIGDLPSETAAPRAARPSPSRVLSPSTEGATVATAGEVAPPPSLPASPAPAVAPPPPKSARIIDKSEIF